MLMLLLCKFCCLSYMTFLAAILDTMVQYLCEVSVVLCKIVSVHDPKELQKSSIISAKLQIKFDMSIK